MSQIDVCAPSGIVRVIGHRGVAFVVVVLRVNTKSQRI